MMYSLQDFNIVSVILRLILAMLFGGIIGLERGKKSYAAGFRTYMLVCTGAALTMLLGQYLYEMLTNFWSDFNLTVDVSRIGAQVINGVGFLGAGSILVTGRRQVRGLTTAAGLWASACMGLAIGAGFYACTIVSFLLIIIVVRVLPSIEAYIVEHSKYMNFYFEFESWENIGLVINKFKSKDVHIYEIEINKELGTTKPNAVFIVRLNKRQPHTRLLLSLLELKCIHLIEKI